MLAIMDLSTTGKRNSIMNMNELVKQSLEAAKSITGKGYSDAHTQEVAFMMACAAMAKEKASQ